jgi:S1-C subfamily serine protease
MLPSRIKRRGLAGRQVVAAAVLATGALLSCSSEQATQPDAPAQLQGRFMETVRKVGPSVIKIKADFGQGSDVGSGVVLDNKGDILTNAHVVTDDPTSSNPKRTPAAHITVSAKGALDHTAELKGCFVRSDVAVIHVDKADLRPARFGDSDKLRVGQMVMAIGSPVDLDGTVTTGIVSALDRVLTEGIDAFTPGEPLLPSLPGLIQTSAQINPGNSGGALVDLDGSVVGMPTLGFSGLPALGFAIGSSKAKDYADQILKFGKVTDSHMGILGLDFDRHVVNGSVAADGVLVKEVVPGKGAMLAGIRKGDLITSVNGKDTLDVNQYLDVLAPLKPGQTVPVGTRRSGSTQIVSVALTPYVDAGGCTETL